jgi:membrane protease YdiL (CAAX protease family)
MVGTIHAGSFAPGIVAAILLARGGRQDLKAWLLSFVRLRAGWRAYALALLPLPIVLVFLTWALGYTPRLDKWGEMPATAFYLTLFPASVVNGLGTAVLGAGPLGEEGGWRGYLLPRMLIKLGELRTSFLVGLIWAVWHLPVMVLFAEWRGGTALAFYLPVYIAGAVAMSFIFTRVWRLGNGSLVPCIWLHGLVNVLGGVAFDRGVWASGWTLEASTLHFLLAMWIVALPILILCRIPKPEAGAL